MAAQMAASIYGVPAPPRGPTYVSATPIGEGPALAVAIQFQEGTAEGLVLSPAEYPDDPGRLPPFNIGWPAILGSDGFWRNASWALNGANFSLTAQGAADGVVAVATSYAYGNWPINVLYNSAGLPAMPWKKYL